MLTITAFVQGINTPPGKLALMTAGIVLATLALVSGVYFAQRSKTAKVRVAADARERDSLDVLRTEDRVLRDLLAQLRAEQEPEIVTDEKDRDASVLRRYRYGTHAVQLLRHLAVRQSAAMDVARGVSDVAGIRSFAPQVIERATRCRPLINGLRSVSKHESIMSLNLDTHFNDMFSQLSDLAGNTIDFELAEAIPVIEKTLDPASRKSMLHSARYVRRHAPAKLSPTAPRFYEHAPVVSRALTAMTP